MKSASRSIAYLFACLASGLLASPAWSQTPPTGNKSEAPEAYTGNGNGGDAVVCYGNDQLIQSVQLYDYYEAKHVDGLEYDLPVPAFGDERDLLPIYIRKALGAVERLRSYTPLRADGYIAMIRDHESHFAIVPDIALPDIPDTDPEIIPQNCKIEQLAVQREPEFHTRRRFVIDQDLWDRMDDDHKAGTILHEVLYQEGISVGHQNSRRIRHFNAFLSSGEISKLSLHEFAKYLRKEVQFEWMDLAGLTYFLELTSWSEDGAFLGGKVKYSRPMSVQLPYAFGLATLNLRAVNRSIELRFNENGLLKRVHMGPAKEPRFIGKKDGEYPSVDDWKEATSHWDEKSGLTLQIGGRQFDLIPVGVEFHADGTVQRAWLAEGQTVEGWDGQALSVDWRYPLKFHTNGSVKEAFVPRMKDYRSGKHRVSYVASCWAAPCTMSDYIATELDKDGRILGAYRRFRDDPHYQYIRWGLSGFRYDRFGRAEVAPYFEGTDDAGKPVWHVFRVDEEGRLRSVFLLNRYKIWLSAHGKEVLIQGPTRFYANGYLNYTHFSVDTKLPAHGKERTFCGIDSCRYYKDTKVNFYPHGGIHGGTLVAGNGNSEFLLSGVIREIPVHSADSYTLRATLRASFYLNGLLQSFELNGRVTLSVPGGREWTLEPQTGADAENVIVVSAEGYFMQRTDRLLISDREPE